MKAACAFGLVLCCGLPCLTSRAQDARTVSEPVIPPVCSVLVAQHASPVPPKQVDDSARLQRAIDACAAGQALRLTTGNGAGAFTAGPLALKSGVALLLDRGVTLYASTDPRLYDRPPQRCGTIDARGHGCRPFISVDDAQGSGIMGEGAIDGQGGQTVAGEAETWWQLARRAQRENAHQNVPRLLEVSRSQDFTLYGITLANSPNFHVALNQVDGFTAWGIRIDAPADARNTDGIDPVSSRNITVAHSFLRTGDDSVAIKAGSLGPSENISVVHNHFYNGHGMSIGSETEGGVRHVLVEDLTMDGATSGLRIKSDVSRGGPVSDVRYRSVCMRNVRTPLDFDTHYDQHATGASLPVYRDIVLDGVRSLSAGRIVMRGLDESHPLSVTLSNVVVAGAPVVQAAHARLALGPGPVQPRPAGEDVQSSGDPANGGVEECENRFVPYSDRASLAEPGTNADRPQLSDAMAARYSYSRVLNYSAASGNNASDTWDPLADPLTRVSLFAPDYIVDVTGPADDKRTFRSLQAAVNRAVGETGRSRRIFILVKPGRYDGLLYVPAFTAPITLVGGDADAARTRISADLDANVSGSQYRQRFGGQFASAPPPVVAMYDLVKDRVTISTPGSAVAWIRNRGFQAKNITFENTYNRAHGDAYSAPGIPAIHSQAVALMVDDADQVQFENVRFSGYQDTLFLTASAPDKSVRSFFHKSYIEGDLDFIFGEATAYFYQSEIKSLGDRRISYAVAPDTSYTSKFGFVFNECRFTHDGTPNALAGRFYLARQWFHNQRCTPYGQVAAPPGYTCLLGSGNRAGDPAGTITKDALETVGKVIILNSWIGLHIDKAHPWSDWNAPGTQKHRPVQYNSDDFWANLLGAKIDPAGLGYPGRKSPVEPFLAEFNSTDE